MHPSTTKTHFRNELLRKLPSDDLSLLQPHFERMRLNVRAVLQPPGAPIEFVYFLESCIASLVATMPRTKDAEVGLVGFEA
jgi:hypothetical protein